MGQSSYRRGGGGGGADTAGAGLQEGACRLILVGFEVPWIGRALRRAAEMVRDQCAPEAERANITYR